MSLRVTKRAEPDRWLAAAERRTPLWVEDEAEQASRHQQLGRAVNRGTGWADLIFLFILIAGGVVLAWVGG